MRVAWVLASAFLLLAGPLFVGAQPSGELNEEILAQEGKDITFYGATFAMGRSNPLPMNTAYPYGVNDYSFGTGDGGCGTPAPAPDGSVPSAVQPECIDEFAENELWWYTTAGFIEPRSHEVCGNPPNCDYTKFHNERGQTKDIYFDTSVAPRGIIHTSADNHGWFGLFGAYGLGWNWDPGYYKDWTAAATVYHVNLGPWSSDPSGKPDLSPIYNQEEGVTVVAYGESEPFDMWSLDATIPSPTCDGECQTVHPMHVELEWNPDFVEAGGVVPYLNDLIVRWEWYQKTDDQVYIIGTPVAGYVWNLNGGEDYPNQITLPVRNPIDVELVFPRFVHDKLVILSVLNTPWGSYDVNLDSIDFEVFDDRGNAITPNPEDFQRYLDVSVAHSGHYDPINLTWIWDLSRENLDPGEYSIKVSASNFQGSADSETVATFTINSDGSGGDVVAGQSGLLSFTNEQFQQYQAGAGVDSEDSNEAAEGPTEVDTKGSPGWGAALTLGLLLAFVARRRA